MTGKSKLSNEVTIVEVGPRDGLQNEFIMQDGKKKYLVLPPDTIIKFIEKLVDAGFKRIEAGSFVHLTAVPGMAGSDTIAKILSEKIKTINKFKDVRFSYLAPNKVGAERAISAQVDEIAIFLSTTGEFSEKNLRKSIEQSFVDAKEAIALFREHHGKTGFVRGYLSTVFGGAYGNPPEEVSPERVADMVIELLGGEMGCYEVSLGDTTGIATPEKVEAVIKALEEKGVDLNKISMHFHDTNGMAQDNIKRSYELGIRTFDAATGGLGGCPFAGPSAKGNVSTENAIEAIEQAGGVVIINKAAQLHAKEFISGEVATGKLDLENGAGAAVAK